MTAENTFSQDILAPSNNEALSIYMERSGKGSRRLSEKLLKPPEYPLPPEDVAVALSYEAEICDYNLIDSLSIEGLIRTRKSEAPRFFAEPFLQGQIHVEGLEGHLRQLQSPDEVYAWLAQAAHDKSISPENFREMARQSVNFYKLEMQQALLKDTRPNDRILDVMSIVIEPEKTLHFAQAAQTAREFLLNERARLSSLSPGIEGAKRAFVDIYTKLINSMVASDIVTLEKLIQQSQLIGDSETIVDAYKAIPTALHSAVELPDSRVTLHKRFDYIKHGIGYKKEGGASAVDDDVFDSDVNDIESETDQLAEAVFSLEQKEKLREAVLSKQEIHEVFKLVLADADMLSAEDESTWSPGRGQRASDNLFQVVYQPIKNTLAVNGVDGVVLSPNGPRSLYDIITVGMHELTHINQVQADIVLAKTLRIGALKGRRVSMLRETGANIAQRQLETVLFGESKPVAYAYAKAIREFEAGGDVYDASKAFYDEKVASAYAIGKVGAAKEAADRVLRLGGRGTNSQAMSYAEENIMNGELADAPLEVRQRATKITTLDLDDQLRLHKYGLLPEISNEDIDWAQILMSRLKPIVNKVLEDQKDT